MMWPKDPERGLDSVIRALEEDLGWRDAHNFARCEPQAADRCTPYCSAPTASRWRAAAPTEPYGCGTPQISPPPQPLPATPAASIQLRSARTAARFPAPLTITPSGCGT